MSEISTHKEERIAEYLVVFYSIIEKDNQFETIKERADVLNRIIPSDVIDLVDILVKQKLSPEIIKMGIAKFLTLVSRRMKDIPYTPPKKGSYLDCMIRNNEEMESHLNAIRLLIKDFNIDPNDSYIKEELRIIFKDLSVFTNYYTIKENVLFPFIERKWENFRCLHIMWSMHDDVRRNLKDMDVLLNEPQIDIKLFNKLIGEIFLHMLSIKFREERILFPVLEDSLPEAELTTLMQESAKIGFPYYQPEIHSGIKKESKPVDNKTVDLGSGTLTIEQIKLIFNHLPVDITYVDENDKVCYFSSPKKRIFPRTTGIIGREVSNCHPPESVHIVEQIIEAFRKGEKNEASFWIHMKEDFVLIQYFALRDESGNYKGVIEVSQKIDEISQLEGEQRLLDWVI